MEKIQKTNKSRNKFKTWFVRVVIVTGLAGLCLGCFIWYANAATAKAGEGIIYDDVECIKGDRVASSQRLNFLQCSFSPRCQP